MLTNEIFDHIYNEYTIKRYLNKPEILYRVQHEFLQIRANIWEEILEKRKMAGRKVPLKDQNGDFFWYMTTPPLEANLHNIDFVAKDKLENLVSEKIQNDIVMESIIDEAFYSSVIEGAFSTKKRTKELVQKKDPKNKSEKMILNNYNALMFILENLDKELDEDILIQLHKIITVDTLDDDEISEKYRDDMVYVMSENASAIEPIYVAPKPEDVQGMMDDLFSFIQDESKENYIHPVIKAWIIHFYFVYIHPFFDGNGRVARAISYMYLLKKGYAFFKFFSITSVLNRKTKKYYKAIKDSEDYGSDLTYFISSYSEITNESLTEVIERLYNEVQHEILLEQLESDEIILNERQKKFLSFMKKKESNICTINEYQKRNKVSYETARRDMNELQELGIFKKAKKGKKFIFKYLGLKGYSEY
ncbi:Fic family protein [Cytobacillus firmus]|uniref:Fic family protein n=1 Tax=Cytobacillus firmus TaxID=1399 RepID=A0AA46SGU8_CYTFI|nr:Fic family protein [Cytobacillus firmus]UYG93172.1 Fic family protein [Cytobacillus firmus]